MAKLASRTQEEITIQMSGRQTVRQLRWMVFRVEKSREAGQEKNQDMICETFGECKM